VIVRTESAAGPSFNGTFLERIRLWSDPDGGEAWGGAKGWALF